MSDELAIALFLLFIAFVIIRDFINIDKDTDQHI